MAQEIADSTLLDTWASSGLVVKPDISKIIEGWQLGEQPPHEYMNWLQNTFGSKLNHILKNGVALWNDETPYLAGSSVQHSGNVWLCKVDNTNSVPTDGNSNWKRIITKDDADLKVALTQFTGTNQSLSPNGYQKLPGGLILQWGSILVTSGYVTGSRYPVTFPFAFPNSCVSTVVTGRDNGNNGRSTCGAVVVSKTSFDCWSFSDSGLLSLNWYAVGY